MAITIPVGQNPRRPARPEPDVKLCDREFRPREEWRRYWEVSHKAALGAANAVQDIQTGNACSGTSVVAVPSGRALVAADSGKLFTNEL